MTPFPHAAISLSIFQQRLSTDLGIPNTGYTIQADAPIPTDSGLYNGTCTGILANFNSMVDIEASGSYVGEVDQYLYNRLDLANLQLPAYTFMPYAKGPAQTVADLLPEINRRSGLQLQPQDVVAYELPVPSGSNCSNSTEIMPQSVSLEAMTSSLLFIGSIPIYVYPTDVPLPQVMEQVFLVPFNPVPTTA